MNREMKKAINNGRGSLIALTMVANPEPYNQPRQDDEVEDNDIEVPNTENPNPDIERDTEQGENDIDRDPDEIIDPEEEDRRSEPIEEGGDRPNPPKQEL